MRLRACRKRSGAKLCASEHANPCACPQHARRTCLQRRLRDSPSAMERARTQRVLRSRARMRASRRVHSPCGLRFHALRIPTRCLARSGLLALAALATCIARQALPPVATIVLVCITAAAAALSARTSSAEARQRIAYRTRDALKSQAITLRSKNRNLTEALEELESESTGRAARSNVERPASPNGRRTANAECFAGPDGNHAPDDASAASPSKHRIANLNAGIITTSPGNSRTATPSASGAANSRAGAAGLFAGAADQTPATTRRLRLPYRTRMGSGPPSGRRPGQPRDSRRGLPQRRHRPQ